MDWLRRLLHPESTPLSIAALDSSHAREVAALHHQGGFARGWEVGECAALICDRTVLTDGIFAGAPQRLAGFVMTRLAADEAEILSIVVAPGHRGTGLGRSLLDHHAATLGARHIERLFLEVEDGNVAAERLYRQIGFREVGRRAAYYPKRDGSRVAAVTMRLDLA